jgi:histidinol dehydrogenase
VIRILESKQVGRLLARKAARFTEAEAVVRPILDGVRRRGDRALMEYARQFDRLERKSVRVPPGELNAARESLTPEFRAAVDTAASNIRAYAQRQMPREWTTQLKPGMKLGQIVRPLDTVAAYIPAGRYPLPSTVMMTAIPAQVAGVPNVCIACPRAVGEVFGTAALLGVRQVFQMGGAQAIAAFAFGTRTVPRADRIVGPGNIYVAAAKKLLAGEVGIDFVAGPTEILIIAGEGDPRLYGRRGGTPVVHPTYGRRRRQIDCQKLRHHSGAFGRRSARDFEPLRARALEHSRRLAASGHSSCGQCVRRRV